jgi:hypothetical protein
VHIENDGERFNIDRNLKFQEKEFLPVEQLKSEKCPRLSLQDMLQIMDIRNGDKTGNS